ncbi:MAG: amino acid permease [candidate division SR1 bacterium]|nr:amino acid permease [candidate division SR1 bacterium]
MHNIVIDKSPVKSVNALPKLLLPVETLSFSLASHITWLIGAPIIVYNLGFSSMYIWVIGSIAAILNLFSVYHEALKYPDISGGVSSYITRLYPQNSFFAKYASLAYFLGWVAIPALSTSLLSIFVSHIFTISSDPFIVKIMQIFFIILISSVGFSSSKLISVFHTILTIPAVITTIVLTLGSTLYLLINNYQQFMFSVGQVGVISTSDFFKYFFIGTIILFTGDIASSFTADSQEPVQTIKTIKWSISFLPFVYILVSLILLVLIGNQRKNNLYDTVSIITSNHFGEIALFFTTIWIISSLFLLCTTVIAHAPRILYQLSIDRKLNWLFSKVSSRGSLKIATLFTIIVSIAFLFLPDIDSLLIVSSTPYFLSYIIFHAGILLSKDKKPLYLRLASCILVPFEIVCFIIGGLNLNLGLVGLGILLPFGIIILDKIMPYFANLIRPKVKLLSNNIRVFQSVDNTAIIFTQILLLFVINIVTILSTWFMVLYLKNESFTYRLDLLALILVVSCFATISLASLTVFSQIQNLEDTTRQLAELNLTLETDIQRRDIAEQALFVLSTQDNLTNLGNRNLVRKVIQKLLRKVKSKYVSEFGIIIVNINRFKSINDSLGNKIGDELLKAVANRLVLTAPKHHTVYRLGGDEFAIIIPKILEKVEMITAAQDILSSFAFPFHVRGKQLFVTASLGVNNISNSLHTVDNVLSETNIALLEAKKIGKNKYSLFDKEKYDRVLSLLNLETKLPEAIKNKEFELFYQPIINLKSNKIAGYETLVRWAKDGSLLLPASFIPMAEETDLVVPLTWQILEKACFDVRQLQKKFKSDYLRVNVNFSLKQFFEPDLVKRIIEIANKSEIAVSCIKIEITESMLQDSEDLKYVMNEMLDNDIKLNLDDFGTGYSSLGYLNTLPISALKIDKSFIRTLNPKSLEITQAMINLAANIGAWTIVEGIETQEQLTIVKEMGANFGQGYYFGRAMPFDEIINFVYPPLK